MPDRPHQPVTAEVRALADARALARAGKDWTEADRLRAEIEAAGWNVVDRGFSYSLKAAHPPDLTDGDVVSYGRSTSVPSRLGEPPTARAAVVLIATDWPADLARTLAGVRAHAPGDTQVIVVADGPSAEQALALEASTQERRLAGGHPEVVRTTARLGRAAAFNVGIRRASGSVVVVLDSSVEPTGDFVTPLVAAFDDPTVAVAGDRGLASVDLRHFDDAPPGDVDAIEGSCLAFRRADAAERGPLDERFRVGTMLDAWWSLVLRDEGAGSAPRRAVALAGLPLARHEPHEDPGLPPAERERLRRREAYRLLERFGRRTDLLRSPPPAGSRGRS